MTAPTFGVDSQGTPSGFAAQSQGAAPDAPLLEYTHSTQGRTWMPGTKLCARCGHDSAGDTWPDCVTAARNANIAGHHTTPQQMHPHTCAKYWTSEDMHVCDQCETSLEQNMETA